MSDGVQLLNQNILWPVVLIALLLLTVFVWKEWEQRNGKRFWVKSVLALMSVASLAMIIWRPATFQEVTKGKAIILTKGYRTAQLDSLRSIYKWIPMENSSPGKTLSILEEADSLFLLGQGLETYDLWQLDDATVSFLGAENPLWDGLKFLMIPTFPLANGFPCPHNMPNQPKDIGPF